MFALQLGALLLMVVLVPSAGAVPTKFYGLTDTGDSHADFEAVKRSGAEYWRFAVNCGEWKRNAKAFYEETDRVVEEAWKGGITVLPFIAGKCEAKSASEELGLPVSTEWAPPFNPYQAFVNDLVHHYGYAGSFWTGKENKREVETWEIGNEPNLAENGIAGVANGEEYGKFFKRISEYLHEAQGTFFPTRALFGGLYYGPMNLKGGSKTPHDFIVEADKVAGIDFWVNGVGIHPYAFGNEAVSNAESHVENARWDVTTYFGFEKDLWITEVGWPVQVDSSNPYKEGKNGEPFQTATLASQADAIGVFTDWVVAHQAEKKIQSLVVFTNKDSAFFGHTWASYAGLIGQYDGEQRWFKPAWFKFQEKAGGSKWSAQMVAAQTNTGELWTWSNLAGGSAQSAGLEAGTSPAIAGLTRGGIWGTGAVIAFHKNNGNLFGGTPYTGYSDLGVAMASGSNPSVTGLVRGNYVVAVRGKNGNLWTWTTAETGKDRGVAVSSGSSPSISTYAKGAYIVAFRGANGNLWTWTPSGGATDRLAGMAANTSPSIAVRSNGTMVIAFQANTGNLWTWTSSEGAGNRLLGMSAGTSPSIAALPNGEYAIAIQANTNGLWTWTPAESGLNRSLAMAAGTNPSVTALPAAQSPGSNHYAVAFRGSNGNLWTMAPDGSFDRFLGMAGGTSPATETGSAPFPAPPDE